MPDLPDLIAYMVAVAALAIVPGPSWITLAYYVTQRERAAAARAVLGVAAANVIFILLVSSGKAIGFALPAPVRDSINRVGVMLLFLLVVRLFVLSRNASQVVSTESSGGAPSQARGPFVESMMIHLANPNSWLFFTSIFLSITRFDETYWQGVATLGLFVVFIDVLVMIVLAQFLSAVAANIPSVWSKWLLRFAAVCFLLISMRSAARYWGGE